MDPRCLKSLFVYGRERLRGCGIDGYALDAEVLLRYAAGMDRAEFLANPQIILNGSVIERYREYLQKRERRIPVAYITNTVEFMSLTMYIDNRALIPRPDTEILVERALATINSFSENGVGRRISVLELCTGSGCIALALAYYAPDTDITAADLSPGALRLASENAERYAAGKNIKFLLGDLFEPTAGRRYDIIIANPPYIPTADIDELDKDVRLFEPITALDGGEDGLDFYRRLCSGARGALNQGGAVLFEIGFDQGAAVARMLADSGFQAEIIKDLSGHDRVVAGLDVIGTFL